MDTEELFGHHALDVDKPEDYIQWAEERLAAGVNSVNIAILAGLDLEKPIDSNEVHDYFEKSIRDIGLEWPDKKSAQRKFSENLCRKILDGNINPQTALSMLAKLFRASDYSNLFYAIWDELEEDISSLETDYGPIFNNGITKDNASEYIKKVAAEYLTISSMDLPPNFFSLTYCSQCNSIAEPSKKRIDKLWLSAKIFRFLFRRGPSYRLICSRCGSENLISMRAYEGREKYLSSL